MKGQVGPDREATAHVRRRLVLIDWPLMTRRGPALISRLKKMAISAGQLAGPRPLLLRR